MNTKNTRRDFIKKASYAAPAVLSLSAMPAIAQIGSPNISKPPGSEVCQIRPIGVESEYCRD